MEVDRDDAAAGDPRVLDCEVSESAGSAIWSPAIQTV